MRKRSIAEVLQKYLSSYLKKFKVHISDLFKLDVYGCPTGQFYEKKINFMTNEYELYD